MKVLTAPLGGVFSSVPVKDAEEALTVDTSKVVDESMCILHRSSPSLVGVFRDAYAEGKLGAGSF